MSAGKVQSLTRSLKNADGRLHLVSIPYNKAAQDWLDRYEGKRATERGPNLTSEEFRQFLEQRTNRTNLSRDEIVRLYNDFVQWNRGRR